MIKVIVRSDSSIDLSEAEVQRVRGSVQYKLGRFEDRLSKVEVHVKDENGGKSGPNDVRCVMVARTRGIQSVEASDNADSLSEAVIHAASKVERILDDEVSKLGHSSR